MTMIFNIFVFYSLFNQINCRIIYDSFNILKRIHKRYLFLLITLIEIIIQILIISFNNTVFHAAFMGLTFRQWMICLGFSAITFFVSIFAKIVTLDKAIDKCLKYEEELEIEEYVEESEINKKKNKTKRDDSSTSERSIKVDETNNFDENKKKDEVDKFRMSDFSMSTEQKTINESKIWKEIDFK